MNENGILDHKYVNHKQNTEKDDERFSRYLTLSL